MLTAVFPQPVAACREDLWDLNVFDQAYYKLTKYIFIHAIDTTYL